MATRNLLEVIRNPKKIFEYLFAKHPQIFKWMNDESYLKFRYKIAFGKSLNLSCPITFNEKLQWLKLHDRQERYTIMVDKFEVKEYVANIIGDEYIIPTLGVWDRFDDIDFDSLPDQFVLKCTHDSGGLVIVDDKAKFDISSAREKINSCLKKDFYYVGREWPYKNVKPRIIAEKYMTDESGTELKDYKVFNFDGKAKIIELDHGRFTRHMRNLYTPEWEYIEAEMNYPTDPGFHIEKPATLDTMIKCAEKLSKGIPFVRTDFYSIDNKLYFGEITFYPASGLVPYKTEKFDRELGNCVKIPGGGGTY